MATTITTTAAATPIEIIPLADVDGAGLSPAKTYGTEDAKLVDGHEVYALPSIVVRMGGEVLKTASVKVKNRPGALTALTPAALTGAISITPWVADGSRSVRLSIVADGVATPARKAD